MIVIWAGPRFEDVKLMVEDWEKGFGEFEIVDEKDFGGTEENSKSERGRRHTPAPLVPAKICESLIASEITAVLMPSLTARQSVPLFVERKIPKAVPAIRSIPFAKRA